MQKKFSFKRVIQFLFSRMVIFGVLIALQLLLFVVLTMGLMEYTDHMYQIMEILSIAMIVWIVYRAENPSYKIAWILTIATIPVFGTLFYIMWGNKRIPKDLADQIQNFYRTMVQQINDEEGAGKRLAELAPDMAVQADYIDNMAGFPVWENTQVDYCPLGEAFFESLKIELKKAKRFIFMEYFILEEGKMWNPIFEILKEKCAEGVEVRFLYDDMGCLQTLPTNYHKLMEEAGIRTVVFNPFRPHLNMAMNYRDHRKICVIDGNAGFCGGINLADEYINAYAKHGHWKDTAVLLKGDAVWNLTLMFLTMWKFSTGEDTDYSLYRPTELYPSDGFIQPFGDSPLDNLNVSESCYMQIINRATDYVYITTPYLILDNEMITALSMAAQSGVDVRIITPHVADKWYVHMVTRSYYTPLLEAGVKIYEYTPGFIHAKMFVSDDRVAVVGTTNMDYRSFYLHFECGVSFYQSSVVEDVRDDILSTLHQCQLVTVEELRAEPLLKRVTSMLLKMLAPLM